ncbi:MAG TPA: ankyrin repeat domain-containing protein [Blastocatellia bacterium]|nr:ankyrin repeat domain-containing protein [Blastocatellia bacterium]
MNKDWEKIDLLFHQALECPNEERAGFLASAAQHDPALGGKLQALLDAHENNHSFMESPAMRVSLSPEFGRWQTQIAEDLAPPSGRQVIGLLLDGKYRLEELCGRGGMGAVYRATHVGTGRRVAVKVIAPELAGNREFIERFRREAKTIGRLRHPNIVNVTDFGITGEHEQTMAYLVMEHLEGVTLAVKLKDKRPLPLADALDILRQTCAGIDEAHRLGILHRDLKPENIWLEPVRDGGCNVKVLDFGIAQLHDLFMLDEPEPLPVNRETSRTEAPQLHPFSITEDETLRLNLTLQQLTRSGAVMGSPKYMSPEQCRGEKLDNASDIYSLGVIAYQMLSGDTPFNGTVAELLQQHREAAPAPLCRKRGNIPATVEAVVCQALAKEPSARPATSGAFAFLLSLQTTGNDWLRRQADAVNRQHRSKLTLLALRLQWLSGLLIGLTLMATVKLPGLRPLQAVLVFGSLWLLIAAITLWKQNSVTAACALFLEQSRKTGKTEVKAGDIVRGIRQRSGALARATLGEWAGLARKLLSFKLSEIRRWADSLLIVPPLMQEGLNVDEATKRSAILIEPLRRKLAYPFFRRLLAFMLVLTAWQWALVMWGEALDGGRRDLSDAIILKLPSILALCFAAFSLSLKSSIEQAVLYRTARQALGEVTVEEAGLPLRQDVEAKQHDWWLSFKTYAPACALLLLMGLLHFGKIASMTEAINQGNIYSVKARQAAGVPLPFWALYDSSPTGFERWLRRALAPYRWQNRWQRFQPYGPNILQSRAMTKFLLEKGVNFNTLLLFHCAPPGVGDVAVTPLHAALTEGHVETARLLIAHGADVHARDSIGRTPLTVAITYRPSAIKLLLGSGVDINEQTRFGPPLLAAARYQWLYPHGGRIRIQERENAVKILMEKGADPNTRDKDGRNALMVMSMEYRSIVGSNYEISRQLGIPPPPPPKLGQAAPEALRLMRIARIMEDAPDKILRIIGGALLQAGCDVNAADVNGRTPLMYAALYNRPTAVQLLLEAGANVRAQDKDGMTALDLTKKMGNQEIIKLLNSSSVQPGAAKKPGASAVNTAE